MKKLIMTIAPLVLVVQVMAGTTVTLPLMYLGEKSSVIWSTVSSKIVTLPVMFPKGSLRAVLRIAGLNHGSTTITLPVGTTAYAWRAFDDDLPDRDDLYTLTLEFTDGSRVLKAETAKLAVLRGSFGATCVKSETNARNWLRLKGNAVIPYSTCWQNGGAGEFTLTATADAGGVVYQNAASPESGWFGFGTAVVDAGLHHLTLSRSNATTLAADVVVVGPGLSFFVR